MPALSSAGNSDDSTCWLITFQFSSMWHWNYSERLEFRSSNFFLRPNLLTYRNYFTRVGEDVRKGILLLHTFCLISADVRSFHFSFAFVSDWVERMEWSGTTAKAGKDRPTMKNRWNQIFITTRRQALIYWKQVSFIKASGCCRHTNTHTHTHRWRHQQTHNFLWSPHIVFMFQICKHDGVRNTKPRECLGICRAGQDGDAEGRHSGSRLAGHY